MKKQYSKYFLAALFIITVVVAYNNCSSYQNQSSQSSMGCTLPGYQGPTLLVNSQPVTPSSSGTPVVVALGSAIQFAVAASSGGGWQPCGPTDGSSYWVLPDQSRINNKCVLQTINAPGVFSYTYHGSENLNLGAQCSGITTDTHATVQVQ